MLKSLEKYGIIDFQDKIEAKKYLSFKLKKSPLLVKMEEEACVKKYDRFRPWFLRGCRFFC